LKRVIYILVAIAVVIGAYIGVFSYLKKEKIRIVDDQTGHIVKNDDTYLHYKVFNDKLLKRYGIDFRVILSNSDVDIDKKYDEFSSHLRKGASSLVLVSVDLKKGTLKAKMGAKSRKIFDDNFINSIKIKSKDPKKVAVKIVETFLDKALVETNKQN